MKIEVGHITNVPTLEKRLKQVGKRAVYVGIPESSAQQRVESLLELAGKLTGNGKRAKRIRSLAAKAKADVTNAELLYIFSKGSPLRSQPARPVLEPAVEADGNREPIAAELAAATKAGLAGDAAGVNKYLKRAGIAGQNAARSWFTDARNGWEPNAESTIAAKGSDRPGIDTGGMRAAITYVMDNANGNDQP